MAVGLHAEAVPTARRVAAPCCVSRRMSWLLQLLLQLLLITRDGGSPKRHHQLMHLRAQYQQADDRALWAGDVRNKVAGRLAEHCDAIDAQKNIARLNGAVEVNGSTRHHSSLRPNDSEQM